MGIKTQRKIHFWFLYFGPISILVATFLGNLSWSLKIKNYYCHDPNQILGFVTMTDMLISSLSLIVGARGLRNDKTTETITRSSGESTLSPRSGVANGEEGKRQNTSQKSGRREWRLERESRQLREVSCESSPTTSALQFYQLY